MAAPPSDVPYVVIVHPDNPIISLTEADLKNIYTKKLVVWPDGVAIRPVDRDDESLSRKSFVELALHSTLANQKQYWQRIIFSGVNVPPPELYSDEAVIRYVLTHRGAIGYVHRHTKLRSVKIIGIE